MLSNGFEIPIRVEATPSKLYLYFILTAHTLAVVALLYPSSLEFMLRLFAAIVVIGSCIYHVRYKTMADRWLWIWQQNGEWVTALDDFKCSWRIKRIFSLTSWFVAIRLINDGGQREDLLLFHDQLSRQNFRRLRVRLQFHQVEATNPGDTI